MISREFRWDCPKCEKTNVAHLEGDQPAVLDCESCGWRFDDPKYWKGDQAPKSAPKHTG